MAPRMFHEMCNEEVYCTIPVFVSHQIFVSKLPFGFPVCMREPQISERNTGKPSSTLSFFFCAASLFPKNKNVLTLFEACKSGGTDFTQGPFLLPMGELGGQLTLKYPGFRRKRKERRIKSTSSSSLPCLPELYSRISSRSKWI